MRVTASARTNLWKGQQKVRTRKHDELQVLTTPCIPVLGLRGERSSQKHIGIPLCTSHCPRAQQYRTALPLHFSCLDSSCLQLCRVDGRWECVGGEAGTTKFCPFVHSPPFADHVDDEDSHAAGGAT